MSHHQLRLALVIVSMFSMLAAATSGWAANVASQDDTEPVYQVSSFQLEHDKRLPFLDPLGGASGLVQRLTNVEVTLAHRDGIYFAPDGNGDETTTRFGALTENGPQSFTSGALNTIATTLMQFLDQPAERPGRYYIAPSPDDIDYATGNDIRPIDRTTLAFRLAFDGGFFDVSSIELSHLQDHPQNPDLDEVLAATNVTLVRSEHGLTTWRPTGEQISFPVADFGGTLPMSAGAIQEIIEQIRNSINDIGHMTVRVLPANGELRMVGQRGQTADGRADGRTSFRLVVFVAPIANVRTIAQGERIPFADRENHTLHERIRRLAPTSIPNSLAMKPELDAFIYRMSRHPGRRVDTGIVSSMVVNAVDNDLVVTENKPLRFYTQISNTGTKQTDEWRYRIGLFHNQLTGNDDILNVEYITPDFDDNQAVLASYNARVGDSEYLRWRVYGSWSEFEASEVGFADERFTGESWSIGAEIVQNVYQNQQRFVDLVGGVRWHDISVQNAFLFAEGDEEFLIPYIGARLEDHSMVKSTDASVMLERNWGSATGVDEDDLVRLGRFDPDANWWLLRWDFSHSFYLEPLLYGDDFRDVSTPKTSRLAHEIAIRINGQHSMGDRLIPQMEQVAGGMYSVRGYEESVAVGDEVFLASLEYRFHIPRIFGPDEPGTFMNQPFRWVPQHPFGHADWDLVFRAFVDAGHTANAHRRSFERDHTLIGAGVGIQWIHKTNLDVRLDWGFALKEIPGVVDDGSSQVHLVATFLF